MIATAGRAKSYTILPKKYRGEQTAVFWVSLFSSSPRRRVTFSGTPVSNPYLRTAAILRPQRPRCYLHSRQDGASRRVSLKNRDSKLQKRKEVLYSRRHVYRQLLSLSSWLSVSPGKAVAWGFGNLTIVYYVPAYDYLNVA